MTRLFNRRLLIAVSLGVILCGIPLAFWLAQPDEPKRFESIACLSFSSDNSRIVVTKLSARDANVKFKSYIADLARTISWLDAPNGSNLEIIQQDVKPGICGIHSQLYTSWRNSALFSPAKDQLVVSGFQGEQLTLRTGSGESIQTRSVPSANRFAFSPSGRFLALCNFQNLSVLDLHDDSVVRTTFDRGESKQRPLYLAAQSLAFTRDESRVIASTSLGPYSWSMKEAEQPIALLPNRENVSVDTFAIAHDDTLVIASRRGVERYGMSGKPLGLVSQRSSILDSVSADGRMLAFWDFNDKLNIYDLTSNARLHQLKHDRPTALALSADGSLLAVGDFKGKVDLIETKTGTRRWQSNPPGGNWPGGKR